LRRAHYVMSMNLTQTAWDVKKLCETHSIKFDGADILDDYLEEKGARGFRRQTQF